MIHPLRRRHRNIFIVLGVCLPIVFVLGVAARKPVLPVVEPTALAVPQFFTAVGHPRPDLFAKTGVQVRLLREQTQHGRFAVILAADKNFIKPDLIVYWVAGGMVSTKIVPGNAVLLGTFGSQPLVLPDQAAQSTGVLALYSLADGEMVDVSKPISVQLFSAPAP